VLIVIYPAGAEGKHLAAGFRGSYACASGGGASSWVTAAASSRASAAADRSGAGAARGGAVSRRPAPVFQGVGAGFEAFGDPLRELLVHHDLDPFRARAGR
jgi:hypothetical protein